ncbi:MAG: hypothetical protein ACK5VF_09930 [Bacteroidota bacterium]
MKNIIFLSCILVLSASVEAKSNANDTTQKKKADYTFAWGLIRSKNYPKNKSFAFEFNTPEFKSSVPGKSIDSSKYEQKSILWGAIQWTEKKKTNHP